VIKVDIQATTKEEQARLLSAYQSGRQLVAEKVETQQEFQAALDAGYDLFQGYFFARPVIVQGQQVPMAKMACMRLLSEMQQEELDFKKLERIIREDVSFPYKLLKYANSALFAFRTDIQSIEHALVLLGEQNVRHWIALAALPLLAQNKPQELVSHSLVRARFCERLAEAGGLAEPSRTFLMGLFSLLDALLDMPLGEALTQAKIYPAIQRVLLGDAPDSDTHNVLYRLVLSYEKAEWDTVLDLAARLRLPGNAVTEAYADSTLWTQQALQATLRKANTRREPRQAVDVRLRVLWQDESRREHISNARLVNVSGFGMQLLVDDKIPLRAVVSCSDPKLGISGRGSVRYCTFSKGKYVVGVEFSNGTGWQDPLASAGGSVSRKSH
jgi:EAL and modified HD-GYP domain-containing signal transduction protein